MYTVPPGTTAGALDNFLATAKVLGGSNDYISGIQTGGTLEVQEGLNVINILYTTPRDAQVVVHYKDTNGKTIAPDLVGDFASGVLLHENGTIIVDDGAAGQPVQVKKTIPNCVFNRCDPLGGITLHTGSGNELTLIYDNYSVQVDFDLDYTPVPNNADHTQPSELLPKTVVYNTAYGDLPLPIRKGHIFDGWSDTAGRFGYEVTADTTVTNRNDHSLYAKWTPKKHKLTFNPGSLDAAGEMDEVEIEFMGTVNVVNQFTNPNYDFAGWEITEGDGLLAPTLNIGIQAMSISALGVGAHNFTLQSDSDAELTAKWTPKPAPDDNTGGKFPATGDDFDPIFWSLLLSLSICVAIQVVTVHMWRKIRQRAKHE
jgi:uncharacterized repeat protein (TIGR02543 family)